MGPLAVFGTSLFLNGYPDPLIDIHVLILLRQLLPGLFGNSLPVCDQQQNSLAGIKNISGHTKSIPFNTETPECGLDTKLSKIAKYVYSQKSI